MAKVIFFGVVMDQPQALDPGFSTKPRGAVWKWPPKTLCACAIENGPLKQLASNSSCIIESMYMGLRSVDFRLGGMNV